LLGLVSDPEGGGIPPEFQLASSGLYGFKYKNIVLLMVIAVRTLNQAFLYDIFIIITLLSKSLEHILKNTAKSMEIFKSGEVFACYHQHLINRVGYCLLNLQLIADCILSPCQSNILYLTYFK
jgi:hypothetical protein